MKVLTHIAGAVVTALLGATALPAQDVTILDRWTADHTIVFDGATVTLDDLHWIARPVIVFADSPNDPHFQQQIDLLMADLDRLSERDVIIITDTDPDAQSDIRRTLRPRGFMLALLGKDGKVTQRKPVPWNVRELARSIDKMPLRQQEIEDRRKDGA